MTIDDSRERTPMSREEVVETLKTMVFGVQAFERFNSKERETLDKVWNIINQKETKMNDILRIREICKENPSCDTCPLCSGPVCLVGIPPCNLNDEELYTIEKVLGYKEGVKE